jgi:imidazolonepropionase-like amidohydrolase
MVATLDRTGLRSTARALALAAIASAPAAADEGARSPGLALFARKALTVAADGPQVVDDAAILISGAKIEAVGPRRSLAIPAGYEVIDLGERWAMPGMIDLHGHVGGTGGDINDMVFQTNEGLRASTAVVPLNANLRRSVMAGVTTMLFIPGSGTNVGGQGILLKTGLERFESMRLRDPGSLKVAQGDNPTRWGYGMGRSLMNFHIRSCMRRGLAYARRWQAFERGEGPRPDVDPQYETFRALASGATQISTHTQIYQLVLTTITMLKGEFGLDAYIDHGEWQGYLAAELAERMGVAAIVGPREIDTPSGRGETDGAILSCAGEYQRRGLSRIGFNTDCPVVPSEDLPLQAAVASRYGFDPSDLAAVRGLTIVPALVAGIETRVGSLEPGKDADVVILDGDPLDPRCAVERVYIEGREVYRAPENARVW